MNHKKFILVLTLLVSIASFSALKDIRKLEDPVLNLPFYSVTLIAPGTTSSYLEETIAGDLEDELYELEDIVEIQTKINDNFLNVKIEAESFVDVDAKLDEIKQSINGIDFPSAVKEIIIQKINPLGVRVLQIAIYSKANDFDYNLNDLANDLKESLETISGVNKGYLNGERNQEIKIKLDFEKLDINKISYESVIQKLQSKLEILPTGKLESDVFSLSVILPHGFSTIDDLENLIIFNQNNKTITLADIGKVEIIESTANQYYTEYNNSPCLFVSITAKKNANLFDISSEADKILQSFEKKYESQYVFTKFFDQSKFVKNKLTGLFNNLLQGICLVAGLIFLILGLRNSIIASIIIPLSIISAIWMLHMCGFALQQVSIAALIISIGLVVDDNIVIIENIHRLISEGYSKIEAITKGVKDIMWAVINSSVTTALVFLPMTQLGGRTGEYIKTLPITVIFCLATSLIFSLILTPVLSTYLLDQNSKGLLSNRMYALANRYKSILNKTLTYPKLTLTTILIILVGCFLVFKKVGVTLFPPADKPILLVDIQMPKGTSFDVTKRKTNDVKRLILEDKAVKLCATNIGHGHPKSYYNIFPKSFNKDYAQIVVFYNEWTKSFSHNIAKLRNDLSNIKDATISIKEFMNGPPVNAPIEIKLLSNDEKSLSTFADNVVDLMKEDLDIYNIKSPFDDKEFNYHIEIDEFKANEFGISNMDIKKSIYMMISGIELDDIIINDKEFPLKIGFQDDNEQTVHSSLSENLKIKSRVSDDYIPLNEIAQIRLQKDISTIEHYNRKKAFTIEASVNEGVNVLEKTNHLMSKIDALYIPKDLTIEYFGEYKSSRKSFGGMLSKLLIAILAIYSVLVLQFKSYIQPIIVLLAIPLAFVGSILILYFFGQTFSFLAFVGFTSITGVVINNSMLLVDTYNRLKQEENLTKNELILKSSKLRFTPILITSITTIFGLLPMVYSGSSLWKPLALTIIGGMMSSTILVLFLIPIILKLIYK